jgi:Kef-type K+ transport system membrane component KefB
LARLAIVGGLLALKMVTKMAGVWPLARMHFMSREQAAYTTLLMATGLTFGTISALFGFQNHIIDQRQYSILVTVVILSAFVPTLVAQNFFNLPCKPCTRGEGSTDAASASCQWKTARNQRARMGDDRRSDISARHARSD